MSLYNDYKSNLKFQLKEKLWKSNIHQVPSIIKIVVSMWIWSLVTRRWVKDFSDLEWNLIKFTWQKPLIIKSRKAISNFKLREWLPVMLKVTLRWKRAFDFIERLINMVLPRVRDFSGLVEKNFDWRWNYNIWFTSQVVFPELKPEEITTTHWVQVTIVSSSDTDNDTIELFKSLWFVFMQKK